MREKAEEILAWGMRERRKIESEEQVLRWENHSRGAAKVAELVAEKAGMDAELAYALGVLHVIGKYRGAGMEHAYAGYEKMMAEGMPEVARVCVTHSFNPKSKLSVLELAGVEGEEAKFVRELVEGTEYDDYDELIQLADFMSGMRGISTLERRFCSVLLRHDLPDARKELGVLYELKEKFDRMCGVNIYELLRDEIIEATFRGTPGEVKVKEVI